MDSYAIKSVTDLPTLFRSAFNFRSFNPLQSECFPICFHSNLNMVISAPTGSGKTVLFELCILRLMSRFICNDGNLVRPKGTLKTIYIAPSKALVKEKLRHWSQKFGSWGISCLELTGDSEAYNTHSIQDADIILTTPEKFDAVSRYRINDGGLSFFSDIALLLIDEVHLLNDPRGAALEAIVSRIKMLASNPDFKLSPLARVRLLAVSATIPNIEDLGEWLMVPPQGIKRFGEEMRPVKLTTRVLGYTAAKNDFLFEQRLQNFIFDVLMQYSKGKSALVFCSTRKGAQEAALRLTQSAMTFGNSNPFIKDQERQERLREASLSCSDKQMQACILFGVGYHHGGVSLKDRNLVEGLFLKGDIQVLCTTNTLAHGINLPAHTVVIKSTRNFNKEKGLYMEYDRSTVLQMCGRAGRPPFDDTGTVVIMTRKETVHLYEDLLNGCEVVESQLLSCVTEHLTAEIVQLTVTDITRAIEWMKCSYMYIRMKKEPAKYGVKKGITSSQIEKHVQDICVKKVNELSEHQLIWADEDGFLLKPLEPGRLMTKYYLRFDTMKYIMQAPVNCSLEDALRIVCRAEEISWIQLRRNEKKLLNDINNDKSGRLRFHVLGDKGKPKKRIQSREEKIFVLTNDCLTGDPSVHDLSMTQDMNSICSNGCRVAKCMKEYFIYKKNYLGTVNSTLLAKSLHQKLWDISQYLLKQLPGIGMVTAKALHSMGIHSFDELTEADPRRIEIVTGRKFPFGNQIKESLQSLPPKVEMEVKEIECLNQGKIKVLVTLTRISQPIQSNKRHYADMIVGSEEDNQIYFHEKIRVAEFNSPYSATVLLPLSAKGKLTVKADLIFEEYLGVDLHKRLPLMEGNASTGYETRSRNIFSFPSPKSLSSTKNNPSISKVKTTHLHNSGNPKEEQSSMPSFNLIDEDQPEEMPEVIAVVNVDDDEDCKIISETTVFDHIREKSKAYPVFSPAKTFHPPSSQLLSLARKRKKPLEPHCEILLEETLGPDFPEPTLVHPSPNSQEKNSSFRAKQGELESDSKPLTKENIFDHIRKKSNNFPVLNSVNKITKSPTFSWTSDDSLFNEVPEFVMRPKEASSDNTPKSPYIISSTSEMNKRMNTPRVNEGYPSSKEMLSFDISMAKTKRGDDVAAAAEAELKTSMEMMKNKKKKQSWSPKGLGNHGGVGSVFFATGSGREVDSYLGCKSVFSFLW